MYTLSMFDRRRSASLFRFVLPVLLMAALLVALVPGGVMAAPASAENAAVSNSYVTYTVTYGDSLSKIAVRYGTTVHALMATNGISNPNRIYVGQVLRIPSAGGDGGWSGSCRAYHTVAAGETLYRIAVWYGTDTYTIAQANNMTNLNRIYVGQTLCIPGGWTPPPPPPVHQGLWYTVKAGDTLNKIAARYGTTIYALMAANNLSNPNRILIGQALWIPAAGGPAPQPQPQPQPNPNPGAWTGLYYANRDLSGSPAVVRQDADIKFDWGTGSPANGIPADNFSVLWTRTFNYSGGSYRFFATSDDGVRVFVDGNLLIDGWKEQPSTGYFNDIYLSPGVHTIRVEYFEASGVSSIMVYWARL